MHPPAAPTRNDRLGHEEALQVGERSLELHPAERVHGTRRPKVEHDAACMGNGATRLPHVLESSGAVQVVVVTRGDDENAVWCKAEPRATFDPPARSQRVVDPGQRIPKGGEHATNRRAELALASGGTYRGQRRDERRVPVCRAGITQCGMKELRDSPHSGERRKALHVHTVDRIGTRLRRRRSEWDERERNRSDQPPDAQMRPPRAPARRARPAWLTRQVAPVRSRTVAEPAGVVRISRTLARLTMAERWIRTNASRDNVCSSVLIVSRTRCTPLSE